MITLDYYQTQNEIAKNNNLIKRLLLTIIAGLILSGLTAIPLNFGVDILQFFIEKLNIGGTLKIFINDVDIAVTTMTNQFPFIAYGFDWLAFALILLGGLFIGPLLNPSKNIWIIQFGMVSSLLIFPVAFIAGHMREVPMIWQFIDYSFGVVAFIILFIVNQRIIRNEKLEKHLENFNTKTLDLNGNQAA